MNKLINQSNTIKKNNRKHYLTLKLVLKVNKMNINGHDLSFFALNTIFLVLVIIYLIFSLMYMLKLYLFGDIYALYFMYFIRFMQLHLHWTRLNVAE